MVGFEVQARMSNSALRTANVFLDTQVFVDAGFNYRSARLASITDLAASDRIRVFLTDITVRELQAGIKAAIEEARPSRPKGILRNSELPQVTQLLELLDLGEVERELIGQLQVFLKNARVTVLRISGDSIEPVLERYFRRLPPFGAGKNKAEFPDALALETLRGWCRNCGQGMAVVSRDEGMRAACSGEGPLFHFPDLPKYLDAVASEQPAVYKFVREEVHLRHEEVLELARIAFEDLEFYVPDLEVEILELELTDIEYEGEVEVVDLKATEATVELDAWLTFEVTARFVELGSGFYEREDGASSGDAEDRVATRKTRRRVGVEVAFVSLAPAALTVRRVWFEGSRPIEVSLEEAEDAQ
jgi:hypothetical protein